MALAALPRTVWMIAAALVGLASAVADASDLPRYALEPGQHLIYEGDETLAGATGATIVERQASIRVVEALAHGGWRLLVTHRHQRFVQRQGERQPLPPRADLYVVELRPDGTVADRGADAFGVIDRLLPGLPPDPAAAAEGWTFRAADVRHEGSGLRAAEVDGGAVWRFEVVPHSARDELNGFSARTTYDLSRREGFITAIRTEHRHRDRVTRHAEDRLVQSRSIGPDELADLRRDAGPFAAIERRYERLIDEALGSTPVDEAPARLAEALAVLETGRDQMRSDMLRTQLEQRIASHRASGPAFGRRLQTLATVLGRPAPAWTLVDLDGVEHRLTEYRGRVVVLDFWYRNCGWCIRAMPQLSALTRRFADRPVAVLGLNTDRDVADARFIADRLDLEYPTLRADAGLAAAHAVRSYPTLVVVGPDGVVRHVHVGYSGTLEDDLAEVIEKLLGSDG